MHSSNPWAHEISPTWQPVLHAAPARHETQCPAPHTWPTPHEVPSAMGVVAVHSDWPCAQVMTPVMHGLGELQLPPALHVLQTPLWQVASGPHSVPSGATALSSQTGPSAPHADLPTRQILSVLQGMPATQASPQMPP